MSFLGFYFNKPTTSKVKGKCGFAFITEDRYTELVDNLSKDYKYILETDEFKNHWGYGYKFTLEDTHLILLNKYKDEIDNDCSLIYFDDEKAIIGIQEDYKLNLEDKQYKSLEEI